MRIDDFLSTVGVIKRRTIAKRLADGSMIEVNDRRAKASYQVSVGDIVHIKGTRSVKVEIIDLPTGSVPKTDREKYFKVIDE